MSNTSTGKPPPWLTSCRLPKGEQPVAVVFILLAARLDLGGQADGDVVHQGIEAVEDSDDAFLFFQWWNLKTDVFQNIGIELRLPTRADQAVRLLPIETALCEVPVVAALCRFVWKLTSQQT